MGVEAAGNAARKEEVKGVGMKGYGVAKCWQASTVVGMQQRREACDEETMEATSRRYFEKGTCTSGLTATQSTTTHHANIYSCANKSSAYVNWRRTTSGDRRRGGRGLAGECNSWATSGSAGPAKGVSTPLRMHALAGIVVSTERLCLIKRGGHWTDIREAPTRPIAYTPSQLVYWTVDSLPLHNLCPLAHMQPCTYSSHSSFPFSLTSPLPQHQAPIAPDRHHSQVVTLLWAFTGFPHLPPTVM